MTDRRSETSGRLAGTDEPRVRGVRAGWLLILVAMVPLFGLLGVTWMSIDAARARQAEVERLEHTARRSADLTSLDGALFEEVIWRSVVGAADLLGLPEDMLTGIFGGDPEVGLADAVATTDRFVDEVASATVEQQLDAVRSEQTTLGGTLDAYETVRDTVRTMLEDALEDLDVLAGTSQSAVELQDSVGMLEMGIRLRSAVADAYYAYYSLVFALRDAPIVELPRLIVVRNDFAAALSDLTAAAGSGSELDEELAAMLATPSFPTFAAAIDDMIGRSLTDGVPEQIGELSIAAVVNDINGLLAVYTAADDSKATTLALLDAAAARVIDTAERVSAEVEEEVRRSYLLVGILIVATAGTVFVVARFLVRPLRGLQTAVDRLYDGEPIDADVSRTGPVEVKAAANTLRRSGEHFSLLAAQTRALAAGDLNADVLELRAGGGLGEALQEAVHRLREALTQQDEFRRQLAHEASHDGLTQIANRNASMAHLARALARTKRTGTQLAVLFVDLDRFKDVNDNHGHHAGDVVLTTTADRLVGAVREGDFVGRLGGDEFIVVAEPVHGIDDAVALSERVLGALGAPIEFPGGSAKVEASIGVALADETHLTADELLRDSDLAVYRAKALGRAGVGICDEELRREVADTAQLANAIGRAIERDEFVVHYQPIVRTIDQHVQAFEALVRWQRSDTDELVPPGLFIGFAERSSLIVDIDRSVLDAVVRQLARWQDDPRFAATPVAVNISARHLLNDDVVAHVLEPLERYAVDPRLLIVEVTESALLDDLETAAARLRRLRELGVRIAIDDFGTGYTSLSHLRSLPVDILKIDRTFTANATTDAGEASMVKLIVDAGHLVGATVTAEGIETPEEAAQLIDLGSDSLQGYYFARPQPPELLVGITSDDADAKIDLTVHRPGAPV